MALQEAIDQEIEENRKLILSKSPSATRGLVRFRCDEKNEACQMGECSHVKRRFSKERSKDGINLQGPPLTLQYCHSAPSIQDDNRCESEDGGHRRNHSFESSALPHLMRNFSLDSQFDDLLDDLSAEDFEGVYAQDLALHSSGAPALQEEKSPITPLMSNRKVLSGDDTSEMNQPPRLAVNETETVENAARLDEVKDLHMSNVFDPSVEGCKLL